VLLEVIFPETAIVVVIVTPDIAAREKRLARVARTLGSYIGMTFDAEICRHGGPFRIGPRRPMLGMTRDAFGCVDFGQLRRIARIVELALGVRISSLARLSVTLHACVIGHSTKWRVTLIARHFDLIMPVRGLPGQINRLVLGPQTMHAVAPHEPRD
jgi:hypothetical protein